MKKSSPDAGAGQDITHHRVFVVRCWGESSQRYPGMRWRFTLEEVGADRRHSFVGVKALLHFLGAWFKTKT